MTSPGAGLGRPVSYSGLGPTAVLGRDAERADLLDRLASHRMVTVVGPGGSARRRLLARRPAGPP
ncbi:MAG: hypothetical protein ACKVWR_05065, partial [Acidimicrobiales bacterium]